MCSLHPSTWTAGPCESGEAEGRWKAPSRGQLKAHFPQNASGAFHVHICITLVNTGEGLGLKWDLGRQSGFPPPGFYATSLGKFHNVVAFFSLLLMSSVSYYVKIKDLAKMVSKLLSNNDICFQVYNRQGELFGYVEDASLNSTLSNYF